MIKGLEWWKRYIGSIHFIFIVSFNLYNFNDILEKGINIINKKNGQYKNNFKSYNYSY
ncbi:MAG: hypothetical protein K0R06_2860 [Clostridium sp.]|nr:hypothetical protein [Clostridium sp.]